MNRAPKFFLTKENCEFILNRKFMSAGQIFSRLLLHEEDSGAHVTQQSSPVFQIFRASSPLGLVNVVVEKNSKKKD
jgi:hypothetical protein